MLRARGSQDVRRWPGACGDPDTPPAPCASARRSRGRPQPQRRPQHAGPAEARGRTLRARDLAPEGSRVGRPPSAPRSAAGLFAGEQSCLDNLLEVVRHGDPAHAHRVSAVADAGVLGAPGAAKGLHTPIFSCIDGRGAFLQRLSEAFDLQSQLSETAQQTCRPLTHLQWDRTLAPPSDAFKPAGEVAPVRRDYITASMYPIAAAITARLARVLRTTGN